MTAIATASTDFWPPDLSQMFPDLVVALATGIFVGLIVLLVERLIDWRRERRNRFAKQSEAVDLAFDTLWKKFHYSKRTLLPDDPELAAIPALLAAVPAGKPWRTVPGYDLLVELIVARRLLEGDVREAQDWIESRGADKKHRRSLRKIALGSSKDIGALLPDPAYEHQDRMAFAVQVGALENRMEALDAIRRGFNRATAAYRLAVAASYNYHGFEDGRLKFLLRPWRRLIGPVKRRRARKDADREGWDLVRGEGHA